MNKYGRVFKMIRNSKNLSIREVAGQDISAAQISRFEKGENDISLSKFMACLQRMDVLLGEFWNFYHVYYQEEDPRVTIDFNQALLNKNTSYFLNLQANYEEKYKTERRASDRVMISVVQVMLNRCDERYLISEKDKEVIADYLMGISDWCLFELWILGSCGQALESRAIEIFGLEIIQKTQFYNTIPENRNRIYLILLNLAGILLDREEFTVTAKFIRQLDNLSILENNLMARLQLKFIKAQMRYMQGNKGAMKDLEECLRIAQFLECYNLEGQIKDTISLVTDS
ncbi:Rgg/GadR/MutR family transcriptional regulator [Streptococcus sp. 121]|uniref:Rgg/GadR/MutR family transcriptional regulator n=1 Tax=Streptococcus sp. 121 TaxID=2797637 RepID=UPI0018F0C08C|nr:Rgg/GadR/MutR family transcriptional regulator [Streptococcus sp. 121]MBJ6745990.1 Rgg/GadR/MutR family transcriptional regulator [Streptococcus sp. 121]